MNVLESDDCFVIGVLNLISVLILLFFLGLGNSFYFVYINSCSFIHSYRYTGIHYKRFLGFLIYSSDSYSF